MRSLGAGLAAAVLVVLGTAMPARAAAPAVEIAAPTDEQRFREATFAFDATVRMNNGGTVRGYAVSWFSAENRPVPARAEASGMSTPSHRIQLPDRFFPWNGRYRVDVVATGRDPTFDSNGDENGSASADFLIDAAPAQPVIVSTTVGNDRKVTVTWQANGEPDMAGYELQRQLGSAPWEHVTVTGKTTTSVVDSKTTQAGGTYRYRVVAFRSSADAGKLNPSLPSQTKTANVPAPPPTTTTTTTTTPGSDEEEEQQTETGGNRSGTSTGTGSGSGSGSSGGRTGGGSTKSPGGSSSLGTATTLPSSGKVDLTGFASLLEQARQSGQSPPAPAGEEPDGDFGETLPFSGRPRADVDDDGSSIDGDDVAIVEEGVPHDDGDRLRSFAFLAGGLLATVLVMHLLWVRSEVRRAELLEAVAPEPPPARPPRRRRFVPEAAATEPDEEREPVAVG